MSQITIARTTNSLLTNQEEQGRIVITSNDQYKKTDIPRHGLSKKKSSSSNRASSSSSRKDKKRSSHHQDITKGTKCRSHTHARLSIESRGIPLYFDGSDCCSVASTASRRSISSVTGSLSSTYTTRSAASCPATRSEMRFIIQSIRQQKETIEERSNTITNSKASTHDFEEQKRQLLAKWDALNTKRKVQQNTKE